MKCSVVVPAAGSGSRFGGEVPKQFASLVGRPLIAHTLSRLNASDFVEDVIVAAAPEFFGRLESIKDSERLSKCRFVEGGESRAESVLQGLRSLTDLSDDSFVAVHDAVRPFVSNELIGRLLAALADCDGVFPAMLPTDTIHRLHHGIVVETPSRDELVAAQTPQCFRFGVVRTALEKSLNSGVAITDEVSAVVRLGYRVAAIDGASENFKVTHREDLERAKRIIEGKET